MSLWLSPGRILTVVTCDFIVGSFSSVIHLLMVFWLRCGNWLRDQHLPWRWLKSPDLEFYLYFMFLYFIINVYLFIFHLLLHGSNATLEDAQIFQYPKDLLIHELPSKVAVGKTTICVKLTCTLTQEAVSTWPVTPGSHHPHWNEGYHAKGRTFPLTCGLHKSATSERFKDEDALLTNMFLNAVGERHVLQVPKSCC